MYAYTAAHKTLPFGTRLKLTNPKNGRTTSVTVNDRGPFIRGRDIDLSYKAAKEVGLIGPGTGMLKVDFVERDLRYSGSVRVDWRDQGPYTIQVGSFMRHLNAIRLKKALDHLYQDIHIERANIQGDPVYRVRIGIFEDRKSALSTAEDLAREGYEVMVKKHEEGTSANGKGI